MFENWMVLLSMKTNFENKKLYIWLGLFQILKNKLF